MWMNNMNKYIGFSIWLVLIAILLQLPFPPEMTVINKYEIGFAAGASCLSVVYGMWKKD